jgi:hypothetical protein
MSVKPWIAGRHHAARESFALRFVVFGFLFRGQRVVSGFGCTGETFKFFLCHVSSLQISGRGGAVSTSSVSMLTNGPSPAHSAQM